MIKKISPLQLCAVLLCSRCFLMMTYFPYTQDNSLVLMTGVLISTACQAVLIIPLVIFADRHENDSPCSLAMSRNKFLGLVFTGAFLLYFIIASVRTIGSFSYFLDYYFENYLSRTMSVIIIVSSAIYIGKMKLQVLGKCAGIVFVIFLLFTIIITVTSADDFSLINFHYADKALPKSLWSAVKSELSRNQDLAALALLIPDISNGKRGRKKCAGLYIFGKFIIIEVVLGLVTIVLGDYALISKLPFFYLAAYSSSDIIERYDAAFMSIWTLMAIIRLSLFFHCSDRCIKIMVPKARPYRITVVAEFVPALFALFWLIPHNWSEIAYNQPSIVYLLVLVTAVPLALIFVRKGAGFNDKSQKV